MMKNMLLVNVIKDIKEYYAQNVKLIMAVINMNVNLVIILFQ